MAVTDRATVYIVDDDASVRAGLARVVRSASMDAVVFASSEAFFAGGFHAEHSCLVVDAKMPRSGGLDMLRRLRREHISIPVIVVTAHDDPETRHDAAAAGAVGYFRKPVDADALLDAITWALDSWDAGDAGTGT